MTNYYTILGIEPTATSTQVRTAYKKLAMAYHPDHNPGNPQAEEIFKIVNEAYHTLSDPIKKSRYDAMLFPPPEPATVPLRELQRRRYYGAPRPPKKYYKVDKEYFRMQGLSMLAFIVLAGFCFLLMNIVEYVVAQKQRRQYQTNIQELKQAGMLFSAGRFDDAFGLISALGSRAPLEYRVHYTRDSLFHALQQQANEKFSTKDFSTAASLYRVIKKYEDPVSVETLQRISVCQYHLGNYAEAVQAMKHLHNQYPDNLELVYSIGLINLEKLENIKEAHHYFSLGKKLFHENLTKVYGLSFEKTMNPKDAPDIYFDIFQGRARTNVLLDKYEEAVADCDKAIFLRPDEGEPYKLRAVANAHIKKLETVCRDLLKARRLGAKETDVLERQFCR